MRCARGSNGDGRGIWTEAAPGRHRVVIVGGGFGGLYTAQALRRAPVEITLIDRQNHHTFQPLLYQVATAALSPADIAMPIRRVLRKQRNARVVMAEMTGIDLRRRRVVCQDGELGYDTLVLATGATHSYFGHDAWAERAPGLKSIDDALEMRSRVLLAFEAAEREDDCARRAAWITFVVVGGGPTGIELSGALAEIARQTLVRDFRRVDPRDARVILIEAAPRLLPGMAPEVSESARRQLEHLGVEVRTGTMVTEIDAEGAEAGGDRVSARTVLWAAGVAASPLGRALGVPLDRAGRVRVEPDLTVPGYPEIYVIGDLATLVQDGKPLPGVAAVAIQEARATARNVERSLRGKPREPFHYRDRGTLATIGRAAAVADLGKIKLSGLLAWLAWLFIHIVFLVGFKNRLLVLIQWAWSYVTFDRGARLITGGRRVALRPPVRAVVSPPVDSGAERPGAAGAGAAASPPGG